MAALRGTRTVKLRYLGESTASVADPLRSPFVIFPRAMQITAGAAFKNRIDTKYVCDFDRKP